MKYVCFVSIILKCLKFRVWYCCGRGRQSTARGQGVSLSIIYNNSTQCYLCPFMAEKPKVYQGVRVKTTVKELLQRRRAEQAAVKTVTVSQPHFPSQIHFLSLPVTHLHATLPPSNRNRLHKLIKETRKQKGFQARCINRSEPICETVIKQLAHT